MRDGSETEENVEELVCVTAQQCASQYGDVSGARGQSAESVTLRRITLQFVHFVGDDS
jgi:hypothetical protein